MRRARTARAAGLAAAAVAAWIDAGAPRVAAAGESCALPASLGFTAEETDGPPGGTPRVVVRSRSAGQESIAPGDVVRQVNGVRVESCADIEQAVREAATAGLVVLVAVERSGRLLALAASAEPERRAPAVAIAPPAAVATEPPRAAAAGVGEVAAPAPAPAPPPPPKPAIAARPDPLAGLSAGSQVAPSAREAATAAARILTSIEAVARTGVPLSLYQARVRAAESELARTADAGAAAGVRAAIDGILEYYRVAGDIRRAKQEWVEDKGSESAVRAVNIPYLSTSRVPRWLAEYPFLREAVGSEPEATNFLVPGESSGSWNPDRAAEILWERAREDTAELAAWGAGATEG